MQPTPTRIEHIVEHLTNTTNQKPLLEVTDLKQHFPIRQGFFGKVVGHVKAVDGVSFKLYKGSTLGLVGESGCGKSTTGRTILRALEPTSGTVRFQDRELGEVNIPDLDKKSLRVVRRNIQLIFQDPFASLNPRKTLKQIVGEPLYVNNIMSGEALEDRVAELLRIVGLRPEYMSRYPHAFSGGQRQRIGIARALALNPQVLICDEPVSALDVSIQAQILNLLQDLQEQFGFSYLFIAHDLSVVEYLCDQIAVMYVGKIVETAPRRNIYARPLHPYTEALIGAVPKPDPKNRVLPTRLKGEVADPANPPSGCYFHPRCPHSRQRCTIEEPPLREVEPGHFTACHFSEELYLNHPIGERA
jgi:peptide/nickel transport system ATP-binding protein